MKESKKEIENAVIEISKTLYIENCVRILLKNVGLHSTIKEVAYQAFVYNKMDYFEKDNYVFDSYMLVRKYCNEMAKNGEVNFNEQDNTNEKLLEEMEIITSNNISSLQLTEYAKEKLKYINGNSIAREFPKKQPTLEWVGAVLDLLEELGLNNVK